MSKWACAFRFCSHQHHAHHTSQTVVVAILLSVRQCLAFSAQHHYDANNPLSNSPQQFSSSKIHGAASLAWSESIVKMIIRDASVKLPNHARRLARCTVHRPSAIANKSPEWRAKTVKKKFPFSRLFVFSATFPCDEFVRLWLVRFNRLGHLWRLATRLATLLYTSTVGELNCINSHKWSITFKFLHRA